MIIYFDSNDINVININSTYVFFSDWSNIDDLKMEIYLNMPNKLLHHDYSFKPNSHLCGINFTIPYTLKMINKGSSKFKIGLLANLNAKSELKDFTFKIPEVYYGELIYDFDQPKKQCKIFIIVLEVLLSLYLLYQLVISYFLSSMISNVFRPSDSN